MEQSKKSCSGWGLNSEPISKYGEPTDWGYAQNPNIIRHINQTHYFLFLSSQSNVGQLLVKNGEGKIKANKTVNMEKNVS